MKPYLPRVLKGLVISSLLGLLFATSLSYSTEKQKPLFKDYMGLNGHSIKFRPELYAPLANHLRDYHPYIWDVAGATSKPPNFPYTRELIDNGKPVNWEELYSSWLDSGFIINTSLQFNWLKKNKSHKNARFDEFPNDVEMYAQKFAEYFGPSGDNKLIESVEIGNEVTHWNDEEYMQLFEAVAQGLRAGDPELIILPATVSSMEKRIPQEKAIQLLEGHTDLFDAINIHTYSFLEHYPTWERTYPEDPATEYLNIITEMEEWRDVHAPGKPIWVTEFGYDSASLEGLSKPRSKAMKRWVSSTDLQQAQWLIRSFILFSELDVERAYMYYFNDKDAPGLHSASGLTRNYKPKPSYYAMRQLFDNLGDYRFSRTILKEDDKVYAYEFIRGDNFSEQDQKALVVWSPTNGKAPSVRRIHGLPSKPVRIESLALDDASPALVEDWSWVPPNTLEIEVGESPVYVFFDK